MRWVLAIACCAFGAAAPDTALAVGGPVPPMQGGSGISVTGSAVGYVAVANGNKTAVERVSRTSGKLERSSLLTGSFGVARAAYDGSTTGLSADGRTLVLAEMIGANGYPPARTRLLVLGTGDLLPRAQITLTGYYAVDAISPTGRWLYLIHALSVTDLTRYDVRAYDLSRQRLLPRPVVDPREDGPMLGLPMTRVMSDDGRWAYTLYDRSPSAPFIHALDTQRRVAVCVDLPAMLEGTISSLRLVLGAGGKTLQIELGGAALAFVDTRTFVVSVPGAKRSAPAAKRSPALAPRRAASTGQGDGELWALGAVAIIFAAIALAAHRRSKVRAIASAAG